MTTEVQDRRATIEAAFEATEKPTEQLELALEAPVTEAPSEEAPSEEASGAEAPSEEARTAETTAPVEESAQKPVPGLEKPPQAWKPSQKAKWAALDPEVRGEVLRRERETTRVLNESAQARSLASEFAQTVTPYMARIQALGMTPVKAIQGLLNADHVLSSAPAPQRAQYMASLIQQYGVDIAQLDQALSGKPMADPVESKVEQLLQQRLAPFQQYLQQQEAAQQKYAQVESQQIAQTVEEMATSAKYPYFEQVRETMADIIELSAKNGRHISIETAYNRAVAVDPDVSQMASQTVAARRQASQAAVLNGKAQKALQASVSVGGAPSGPVSGTSNANNRRAVIEAAFAAAGNR